MENNPKIKNRIAVFALIILIFWPLLLTAIEFFNLYFFSNHSQVVPAWPFWKIMGVVLYLFLASIITMFSVIIIDAFEDEL